MQKHLMHDLWSNYIYICNVELARHSIIRIVELLQKDLTQ